MNKGYWYDVSETECQTEFKTKSEVLRHLYGYNENDRKDVVGCKVYRNYSNSETVATYEIRLNSKGVPILVKIQ